MRWRFRTWPSGTSSCDDALMRLKSGPGVVFRDTLTSEFCLSLTRALRQHQSGAGGPRRRDRAEDGVSRSPCGGGGVH